MNLFFKNPISYHISFKNLFYGSIVIYNVASICIVQQSDSVIYVCIFSYSFLLWFVTGYWIVGHAWVTNTHFTSLVNQMVKNLPEMQETCIRFLGQEDPLEKGMVTHSSILAWRIPQMEEPGGLQSMGSPRVGHDWVIEQELFSVQELSLGHLYHEQGRRRPSCP